ncbi:ScyD/ScyE family protein [Nocardioides sp.]|uniref:ScyD/ScyE family protein n=1 Tax=Nocardioides sp. TaxID=35761 RepID=UPI001A274811|nr:ScyD/ScyE family protein [Nocardioides sp.]MBJ7358926.1 ScyD/ScyE family protein [Nocardioides sp.]
MKTRPVAAAAASLALVGAALAGTAPTATASAAKADPQVATVAKGLVGPLSVAQAPDGTRYWADTFAGVLYKQAVDGTVSVVYKSKKSPPEGVSADGGVVRFTTGSNDNKAGKVWTLDGTGAPVLVADTFQHEKRTNPDKKVSYGFVNTPEKCLSQVPKNVPASYPGVKESHPYATAVAGGVTYVADAGANAVFAVSAAGEVSTVAVIKPAKVKITAEGAEALGLPRCTVGRKYAFEGVPTDIEVGPDGSLYVTSLPGGPEDGSLGANGRVLKVNPATGRVSQVAGGLISPTGVAVAANGDVYVAQLFRGVISKIRAGSSKVRTYLEVPLPAAVETTPTGLLATVNALPGQKPKGKVVTITP